METSDSKQLNASLKDQECQSFHPKLDSASATLGSSNSKELNASVKDQEWQSLHSMLDTATLETSNSKYVDTNNTLLNLKEYLQISNLKEICHESKSLDILVLGDLQDSNFIDGLIGLRLSEMSRSTITTDDGAEEIVVYRAMREGIDVTVWNAPSLSFHQEGYVQEIKRILKIVDLKLLYNIGRCPSEVIEIFKHITGLFRIISLIIVSSSDLSKYDKIIEEREIVDQPSGEISWLISNDYYTRIILYPEIRASNFFFDCISYLCYLCLRKANGALLKLNLKRFKHIPEDETVPSVPCDCPVEEQPLTFTVYEKRTFFSSLGIEFDDDDLIVKPRRLLPTEPQPPPEEAEDKSEPVQELTHFYTGTHDLQFGAHGGGAQATPSGGPPASNQE